MLGAELQHHGSRITAQGAEISKSKHNAEAAQAASLPLSQAAAQQLKVNSHPFLFMLIEQ